MLMIIFFVFLFLFLSFSGWLFKLIGSIFGFLIGGIGFFVMLFIGIGVLGMAMTILPIALIIFAVWVIWKLCQNTENKPRN